MIHAVNLIGKTSRSNKIAAKNQQAVAVPALKGQNRDMANRKKKLSRAEIHAMRGSIKLNTDGKPFAEWMTDLNREEIELEERKFQWFFGRKSKLTG